MYFMYNFIAEITKFTVFTVITKLTYFKNLNTETCISARIWFCNVTPALIEANKLLNYGPHNI